LILRRFASRLIKKVTQQERKALNFWITLGPVCTFFDIGASYFYNKNWTIATQLPTSTMVQVDPNEKNLDYVDRQKITAAVTKVPYALSRTGGLQNLYVTNVDSGSTMFEPWISPDLQPRLSENIYSYFYPTKTVKIQTRKLTDIIPTASINQPIVLKLDTQGSEHEIIRGAEILLKTQQIIAIEVEASLLRHSPAKGGTKFSELQPYLEDFGYELVAMNLIHGHGSVKPSELSKQGILNECDALFVLNHREIALKTIEFRVASFFVLCIYGQFGDALRLSRSDKELNERVQNAVGKNSSLERILRTHRTYF
jgi:FkbM family methyltransferase